MSTDPQSEKSAWSLALGRLNAREYSRAELAAYLARKGCDPQEIEATLQRLVSQNWIDDSRYARAMVRDQALRGKGPRWIQAKLRQKGVKLDLTEIEALYEETATETQLESAQRYVERRYPSATQDPRVYRRAFGALLRRGFSVEIAQKTLGKAPRGAMNKRETESD